MERLRKIVKEELKKVLREDLYLSRVHPLKENYERFFGRLSEEDKIPGGLADDADPKDFDPEQISMGIKVEMEHTSDPKIALEIAMDHLTEDPKYYTKLKKMESGK